MNHFMLPESESGAWGEVSARLRYGNFAMERLINDILEQGGLRVRLDIKRGADFGVSGPSVLVASCSRCG